jgi:membrane associated rhomboid family serine protease
MPPAARVAIATASSSSGGRSSIRGVRTRRSNNGQYGWAIPQCDGMMAVVANTFCYRHPDRTTGVSCTRCGRSICADCMVVAPVGHHCPTCVAEGRADMRRVRSVRWRGAGRGPVSAAGWGVKVLVAANVAVFLVELAVPETKARFAGSGALVAGGEVYRLVTAMFLHSGVLHLGTNMLSLFIAGTEVEGAVGTGRFLVGYLLAGLGASVCSTLFLSPGALSVGASGAVFGLFGAWFVLSRSRGLDFLVLLTLGALVGWHSARLEDELAAPRSPAGAGSGGGQVAEAPDHHGQRLQEGVDVAVGGGPPHRDPERPLGLHAHGLEHRGRLERLRGAG